MSIKDEQIYEASKEILFEIIRKTRFDYDTLDTITNKAAKMAKLMADEIDDHPAHKRIR